MKFLPQTIANIFIAFYLFSSVRGSSLMSDSKNETDMVHLETDVDTDNGVMVHEEIGSTTDFTVPESDTVPVPVPADEDVTVTRPNRKLGRHRRGKGRGKGKGRHHRGKRGKHGGKGKGKGGGHHGKRGKRGRN